jgi:HEAT repeat protein
MALEGASLTALQPRPYDPAPMARKGEDGQANLTAIAVLVGVIIAAVWIWKRLPIETQEYVIDEALPLAAAAAVLLAVVLTLVKKIRRRREGRRERDRLLALFQREMVPDKRLELSFALAEINGYRVKGLEAVVPDLKELWMSTLRRALGDKQHRIRGMAASHLGILQDQSVVPLLIKALEDDHAYVRACAALGLGRLRAAEARDRLMTVMEEDWDQTVRSRAKEAVERIRAG